MARARPASFVVRKPDDRRDSHSNGGMQGVLERLLLPSGEIAGRSPQRNALPDKGLRRETPDWKSGREKKTVPKTMSDKEGAGRERSGCTRSRGEGQTVSERAKGVLAHTPRQGCPVSTSSPSRKTLLEKGLRKGAPEWKTGPSIEAGPKFLRKSSKETAAAQAANGR
jgi:hypothetical protein